MFMYRIKMVYWALIFFLSVAKANLPDGCTEYSSKVVQVYRGWPLFLSCEDLFWDILYGALDPEDHITSSFNCTIEESGSGQAVLNWTTTVVASEEYEYDHDNKQGFLYNATNSNTDWYKIVLTTEANGTICYYKEIRVNVSDFVNETCEESRKNDALVYSNEKTDGDTSYLPCEVLNSFDGPQELAETDRDGAEIHWLFNCQPNLPTGTRVDPDFNLQLQSASYQRHPGVYTCAVTYNGMTRYRIHHQICIRDAVTDQLSISCPDYRVEVGKDVEIVCDVDAGLGHANDYSLDAKFEKLDGNQSAIVNTSCDAYTNTNESVSSLDPRHSCDMTIERLGDTCYTKPPVEEFRQAQRTHLKMYYRIEMTYDVSPSELESPFLSANCYVHWNVQLSDFGEYLVSASRNQHEFNATFTIEKVNIKVVHLRRKILVGVIVPVVIILIVAILLGLFFRVEVKWMKRRCFGSKEKVFKRYAGYLAYDYCEDMNGNRSDNLKKLVDVLNVHVKRLGGELYDKNRVPEEEQGEAANINAMLPQCHRVIILLTPEYINSHWGMHQAYAAWKNVIDNGIPIIFFKFPSTKSAIKSLDKEPRVTLEKALKMHGVIKHDLILPFNRRQSWKFENLMPIFPRGGGIETAVVIDNYPAKANGTTANGHVRYSPDVHENGV